MTGTRLQAMRAAQRPNGFVGSIAVVLVLLFAGTMITILLALAIWPGEVKLVAPLFCDDAQPDAFVVTDTYNPAPGETTTDFTLYCVGPAGDATDKGFALPFLATVALNTAVLLALILIFSLIRRLRSRRTGGPPPSPASDEFDERLTGPATTAGPFVD